MDLRGAFVPDQRGISILAEMVAHHTIAQLKTRNSVK
jgi:hypothetical protein